MDREKELSKKKYVLAELEVAKSGEVTTSCYTGCTNGLGHRITEMIPNRLLTPSEHAVDLLDEVKSQASEIDRLNRIMPKIGETCKWQYGAYGCEKDKAVMCEKHAKCHNENWRLKTDG